MRFASMVLLLVLLAQGAGAGKLAPPVLSFNADKGTGGSISADHGQTPSDVVVLDFNRDGIADLAVSYAFSDEIGLFQGDGAGQFELTDQLVLDTFDTQTFDDAPRRLFVADFDHDGIDDLLSINSGYGPFSGAPLAFWTAPTVGIFYGLPRGGFEPMRVLDTAGPNSSGEQLFAFSGALGVPGTGGGQNFFVGYAYSNEIQKFEFALDHRGFDAGDVVSVTTTGIGPFDLQAFELSGPNSEDLLIVNEHDVQIRLGGTSTVPNPVVIHEGTEMLSGRASDFDQDGLWDVAVVDGGADQLVVIWGLDASAQFERKSVIDLPQNSGAVAVRLVDANLDGFMDLIVLYNTRNRGQVYLNRMGRRDTLVPAGEEFHPALQFETSRRPRAVSVLDLDDDLLPDFVVANEGDQSNTNGNALNNQDVVMAVNTIEPARGFTLIGNNTLDISGFEHLGPQLKSVTGLAWDHERERLWTIDREQGLLVALNTEGDLVITYPLTSIAPDYLDFVDVEVGTNGTLWLLDRARNRVNGWHPVNSQRPVIDLASFSVLTPEFLTFDGTQLAVVELNGRIVYLSEQGSLLGTNATSIAHDLAYSPARSRFMALVHQNESLSENFVNSTVGPAGLSYELAALDDTLKSDAPIGRWITFGEFEESAPDRIDMWLLDANGTLAQFRHRRREINEQYQWEIDLRDAFELKLLKEVAAIEHHSIGGLLLGDAGALGSIVYLFGMESSVEVEELELQNYHEAFGLGDMSSGDDFMIVANGTRNADDNILFFEGGRGGGFLLQTLTMPGMTGGIKALYYDQRSAVLYAGQQGRLVRRVLEIETPDTTPHFSLGGSGAAIEDIPLPAYMKPTAISAGPRPGTLAVWVPDFKIVLVVDPDQADHREYIARIRTFSLGFQAQAGVFPQNTGESGWMAGTGASSLLQFNLEAPFNAADSWHRYH